jgi:hypothetical protein
MLSQLPAAQRVNLVSSLNVGEAGDTLQNVNVGLYPDGALFFVNATQRMYALRKNLPVTVVAGGSSGNVVAGVGSDNVQGFFVACEQSDVFTLSSGTQAKAGWSLPSGPAYFFLATLVNANSTTTGFVHAARTDDHTVTLTSAQGADGGTYLVVMVPTGEG